MSQHFSQGLLPELDQEMANTRRCLERIPEDRMGWKPHEKSMSLGRLGGHLAEIPHWLTTTLQQDSFDVAPPGGPAWTPRDFDRVAPMLELFDGLVDEARAALEDADDETMMQNWSLLRAGETMFSLPRIGVIRGMVLNHLIHHRGQLSVYLRLLDVPVPAVYGPSADEGNMG